MMSHWYFAGATCRKVLQFLLVFYGPKFIESLEILGLFLPWLIRNS